MKSSLRFFNFLAILLGVALLFSCEKPGLTDPDEKVIPVENVKLDVTSKELVPGETLQLTATLLPANATDKDGIALVWNSSDPAVASVNDAGLVTAVSDGTATVGVSIPTGKKAQCEVTVKTPERVEGVIKASDFGQTGESGAEDKEAGYDFSYQFAPRAALASDEVMRAVKDVWTDGHNYSFSLPATHDSFYGNSSCINADDIIVFRDSEAFPGGAAVKIVSSDAAQKNSGTAESFEYQGYQVPIEEVFKQLHLETAQLNLGEIQRIVDEEGNPVEYTSTKGGGFEIAIPEMFGKNFTASLDLGENMSITPKMRIGFNMDIAADVVDFKLTYARCRVEAEADLSCDLTFKASVDKKFRTKRLTVYLGAIPVGPVVISPVISMDFELKLSGQVDLTLSVAYQKSVYAHAFYNGSDLQCRVGEKAPSDTKDPFSVTGSMSGAVEFGPNLGMGVSLYGGALTLGVDFDPHLVYTVFSSYPISLEGLQNIGNGYYWLTQAGFEPSLAFKFGGYIDAAYAWSMDFQVPDELGLSYSFGKTYVVPQLAGPVNVFPERTAATISTTVKNKAMFDDKIYMKVKEADDPSDNWKEVPFTLSGTPNNENPVEADAIVSPIKPFQIYEAIGPFMKISLFGKELEVQMARNERKSFYTVDEKTDNAVRALLSDLYACRDGKWEGCNWTDPDVPFSRLENVWFHYDTDQEAATYGDDEYYYRKKLGITIPDTWKMGNNLKIKDCTSQLEDLGWDLTILGGAVFDSIEIEDPNFHEAFGDETEEFGGFRYIWPTKQRLVIHSKRFGNSTYGFSYAPVNSSNTDLFVDLSGTGIREFWTSNNKYWDDNLNEPTLSGTVILDDCKLLHDINVRGPKVPEKLSFKNCPKLEEVTLFCIPELSDISAYAGICKDFIIDECGGVILLGEGLKVERKISVYEGGPYTDLVLDGVQGGAYVEVSRHGNSPSPTVTSVSLSNCPELTGFKADFDANIETLEITGCTKLETIDLGASYDIDYEWIGPLRSISVSACPSLNRVLIHSSILNGTLPSFIRDLEGKGYADYPFKYSYYASQTPGKKFEYKAHSNGYTMPGEPDRIYRHCLGGYYDGD
ncbi:MAG: Ig domain-containing protein [Bacteroidales bacterium]|nr:Ig domain-containing protein [Bacteroidales bacterium]